VTMKNERGDHAEATTLPEFINVIIFTDSDNRRLVDSFQFFLDPALFVNELLASIYTKFSCRSSHLNAHIFGKTGIGKTSLAEFQCRALWTRPDSTFPKYFMTLRSPTHDTRNTTAYNVFEILELPYTKLSPKLGGVTLNLVDHIGLTHKDKVEAGKLGDSCDSLPSEFNVYTNEPYPFREALSGKRIRIACNQGVWKKEVGKFSPKARLPAHTVITVLSAAGVDESIEKHGVQGVIHNDPSYRPIIVVNWMNMFPSSEEKALQLDRVAKVIGLAPNTLLKLSLPMNKPEEKVDSFNSFKWKMQALQIWQQIVINADPSIDADVGAMCIPLPRLLHRDVYYRVFNSVLIVAIVAQLILTFRRMVIHPANAAQAHGANNAQPPNPGNAADDSSDNDDGSAKDVKGNKMSGVNAGSFPNGNTTTTTESLRENDGQ